MQEILYDVEDNILTITLNRPDKLNAFTPRMLFEMIEAFDRADADDNVRAIIVTGAGRAFCAGADLSGGGGTFDPSQGSRPETLDEHRDGGGLVTLDLRVEEARYCSDQRSCRWRRYHDDASDGCTHRL
jgi:enoyl-CoA hydratase/carnithine racemase